jgi:chitinase
VLGDTIMVNCTATDNVGVTKVDIYIDGSYITTGNSAPYSFWYLPSAAGSHTIKLKAFDAEMNTGESSVVTITAVQDSSPPSVSINSPWDNSSYTSGDIVEITCSANDNLRVKKVELYLNGSPVTADTSSPYSFTWDTESIATGKYTLKAVAYDGAGNTTESSEISVFIESGEPPQISGLSLNGDMYFLTGIG